MFFHPWIIFVYLFVISTFLKGSYNFIFVISLDYYHNKRCCLLPKTLENKKTNGESLFCPEKSQWREGNCSQEKMNQSMFH